MSLGRRQAKQEELFIAATQIVKGSGHPFYCKLNEVLQKSGFDGLAEQLCEEYCKKGGRPGIPPGVYFRMLLIGYFEGLESQRGIAWRCADSLALREFLGYRITEATPVHASMTIIRQRLPERVFERIFQFVLRGLEEAGLLQARTLGIDATTLEANAAMKSIVRKDTGKDWSAYLRELARAEGIEEPSEEDLRRLDRKRPDKKVSNREWESRSDPEARITKMKDGRTHLAYKAEHAVDLESEAIVGAQVTQADRGDPETGAESLLMAQAQLVLSGSGAEIRELVADKGYHANGLLAQCQEWGVRTYLPERRQEKRTWVDKPPPWPRAFRANRRRVRGDKGRRLNRWRSEKCERTFAHVCDTGGGRRAWLRGVDSNHKVHLLRCAAYNLGLLMRKVHGMGKPRSAWIPQAALLLLIFAILIALLLGSALHAGLLALALLGWIRVAVISNTPLAIPRKRTFAIMAVF